MVRRPSSSRRPTLRLLPGPHRDLLLRHLRSDAVDSQGLLARDRQYILASYTRSRRTLPGCLQQVRDFLLMCNAKLSLFRLPPLLSDVPTDADYAMQLISQRVAAGQDILPPTPQSKIHLRGRSEEVKTPKPFVPKSLGEIGKLMTQEAGRITRAAMVCPNSMTFRRLRLPCIQDVREGRPVSGGVHPLVSNALAIVIPEANPDVYSTSVQSSTAFCL
jgi:hypothetical protein